MEKKKKIKPQRPRGFEDLSGNSLNELIQLRDSIQKVYGLYGFEPLETGIIEYSDGTNATEEQMAKDVVSFLMWTAEPHLEQRHKTGFRAIVYLIILTVLVYFSMKKIWSRVETNI